MNDEIMMNDEVTIITHGDLDGIVAAAIFCRRLRLKEGLEGKKIKVLFAQPFALPSLPQSEAERIERIIVLDIAINNRNPQMTKEFIESIAHKLLVWIDHHRGWEEFLQALPEEVRKKFLITKDKAASETIFRIINGAENCPDMEAFVRDAIIADTRSGELSPPVKLIDEAIKSNLSDDSLRQAAVMWLVKGTPQEGVEYQRLKEAQMKYKRVQETTQFLSSTYQLYQGIAVVFVDTRTMSIEENYDLTQLLLHGEKISPKGIAVVIDKRKDMITIATNREEINLVALFGLPSGSQYRISMIPAAEWPLDKILEKLKNL